MVRIFTPLTVRLLVSLVSIVNYYMLLLFAYLIYPLGSVLLVNTLFIPITSVILSATTFIILHRAKVNGKVTLISWISIVHLLLFLFVAYFVIDTFINPHGIWIYKTSS
jgi:hypothetical protein